MRQIVIFIITLTVVLLSQAFPCFALEQSPSDSSGQDAGKRISLQFGSGFFGSAIQEGQEKTEDGQDISREKTENEQDNLIILLVFLALVNIVIFYLRYKIHVRNKAKHERSSH